MKPYRVTLKQFLFGIDEIIYLSERMKYIHFKLHNCEFILPPPREATKAPTGSIATITSI